MATGQDAPDDFDNKLKQRQTSRIADPLRTIPTSSAHQPRGRIPNTPLSASIISFSLGCVFTLGFLTFLRGGFGQWWSTYQLGFFIASWAAFHWGEFAVTAGWNSDKCSVDSFLLENGNLYHIAHSTAIIEYIITNYFRPSWKEYPYVSVIGICLVVFGQTLRSIAMIHAASNFSHSVALYKMEGHVLVTRGVYSWFRHPSYTGFFYWALGTQLVLQNPLTFIAFAVILWRFFDSRIKVEEKHLVRFFGNEYLAYRQRVGTKIPLIP